MAGTFEAGAGTDQTMFLAGRIVPLAWAGAAKETLTCQAHTFFLAFGLSALLLPASAGAVELGPGRIKAVLDNHVLEVYTYHPSGCAAPSILLVFHGNGRTAESYRDSAEAFAESTCFVVYAPLFDKDRFPNWSYHRGGITDDGEILPEEDWTIGLVDDLIAWTRAQEGRPDAPVFLFGHSAGAQFLSRVAAYSPPEDAARIILANPSTYVRPSAAEAAPYGFGLFAEAEISNRLRDYLAAPVTVFLGLEDTGDQDLTMTEEAQRQGENRLERGRSVFEEARRVAESSGWPFNWRLTYANDVGHTARGMLAADEMVEALGF